MPFIQQPAYILAVILLLIVFSEWLATKKIFKHVGSVTIVIIATAIVANCRIIPSSSNAPALYDKIFEYAAPLGIFFLLLDVKLKDLKRAGAPMLGMFLTGSLATIAGVVAGYFILAPQLHQIPQANVIAGMFTGTYIGGSANLNAVALNYGLTKNGTLYAAINVVDNIMTTTWIVMTIFLPPLFQKMLPRKKITPPGIKDMSEEEISKMLLQVKTNTSLKEISILMSLALGSLFFSGMVSKLVPQIPSILVLTVFAILLAQFSFVQKLRGGKVIGLLLIMLFLAVIGAYCDIGALLNNGHTVSVLFLWDASLIFIHGLLIFSVGWLFKQDWDIVSVASNANIGGATSAPACAISLGRPDLQLPGILAGTLGNAIGTFAGLLVAEFLK
jgi:uncharacterized membrane protein